MIRDVVTKIPHWRSKNWRQPDCIDSKLNQMAQPRYDAAEIPNSISVRVLERARIDLVDHSGLPPRCTSCGFFELAARRQLLSFGPRGWTGPGTAGWCPSLSI